MRHVFLAMAILVTALIGASKAEDKKATYGWQKELVSNFNINQTNFDNWAQGGENSFAWQININTKFVNNQKRFNWANTAKFSFGKTRVGQAAAKKSVDEIRFESVFGVKLGIELDPYISFMGETQTSTGYKYTDDQKTAIAAFMDPGYFVEGFGFGLKVSESFKIRLGGALKQTVTNKYPVPYSDDPRTEKIEKFKNEVGIESVSDFSKKLTETTLLTSKLELFSNLKGYKNIDVRWDNLFSTKISRYININMNIKLFYDSDISKKRQIKQALTLGLTYSFL